MSEPCREKAELMISMFAKADPFNQGIINRLLESIGYCVVLYAGKFVAVPENSIVFPNQEAK